MGKIVVESEWLKLALNLLGIVSIAVVGYVNHRVTRLEDGMKTAIQELGKSLESAVGKVTTRVTEVDAAARAHALDGDKSLWDAFTTHARETHEFRERVLSEGATKADLNGVKQDLKEHISTAVGAAVATLKSH